MAKIVLLAHKFPPFKGVGANRWAHLTKFLANLGFQIDVITVERGHVENIHTNVRVHKVKSDPYYKWLQKRFHKPIVNAIWFRLLDLIRRFFYYDDEAQHWGKYAIPYGVGLCNSENVDIVIATGAPFQSFRIASKIKEQCPNVKLVLDWRDEWADTLNKPFLFECHLQQIKAWEKSCLKSADMNVFVTPGLEKLINKNNCPSMVVTNGSPFLEVPEKIKKKNIWIHTGTIGSGRDKAAEAFFQLCKDKPSVLQGAKVEFYGRISVGLKNKFGQLFKEGTFVHCNEVSQLKLADKIAQAKLALQFNSPDTPFALSTKLFEYPSLGTPVLSINYGGDIEDFMHQHPIGVSVNPERDSIENAITSLIAHNFDLDKASASFRYDKIASQYAELLNSLLD